MQGELSRRDLAGSHGHHGGLRRAMDGVVGQEAMFSFTVLQRCAALWAAETTPSSLATGD